jgi:hypothetical protein
MPPWCDFPPAAYGSVESMAASLIEALTDRDHEIVMIAAGTNGTWAEFLLRRRPAGAGGRAGAVHLRRQSQVAAFEKLP